MVILQGNKYLTPRGKVMYRLITNAYNFHHSNYFLYPVLNTAGSGDSRRPSLPLHALYHINLDTTCWYRINSSRHNPTAGWSQRCPGGHQQFPPKELGTHQMAALVPAAASHPAPCGTQGCPCCIRWTSLTANLLIICFPFLKAVFLSMSPTAQTQGTAVSFLALH